MAYTVTPTVKRLINKARQEIVLSCEIDDGEGDVRTISQAGKALTQEQREQNMDRIIRTYLQQRAHEDDLATVKAAIEEDARVYLTDQLNK